MSKGNKTVKDIKHRIVFEKKSFHCQTAYYSEVKVYLH